MHVYHGLVDQKIDLGFKFKTLNKQMLRNHPLVGSWMNLIGVAAVSFKICVAHPKEQGSKNKQSLRREIRKC